MSTLIIAQIEAVGNNFLRGFVASSPAPPPLSVIGRLGRLLERG